MVLKVITSIFHYFCSFVSETYAHIPLKSYSLEEITAVRNINATLLQNMGRDSVKNTFSNYFCFNTSTEVWMILAVNYEEELVTEVGARADEACVGLNFCVCASSS